MDWWIPTSNYIVTMNYAAVQHSLQQLVDAGRTDVRLLRPDSDYWTSDEGYIKKKKGMDVICGTAWYHYKGRIKTRSREFLDKLFVRAMFSGQFNYDEKNKERALYL